MSGIKKFIKSIFFNQLISKLTGISYGWHGNYKSWEIAKIKCKGYDETPILDKVAINALKVKNGEISYERDAVSFDKIIYSFPVLASLMWISGQNKK